MASGVGVPLCCHCSPTPTLLMLLPLQACVPLDPNSSVSIRNQSELLRCFTVLCELDARTHTHMHTHMHMHICMHTHTCAHTNTHTLLVVVYSLFFLNFGLESLVRHLNISRS